LEIRTARKRDLIFPKCAPRAGESSIWFTAAVALELACKENKRRVEARAPLPSKMRTRSGRKQRGASTAAPSPKKDAKVKVKRTAPRRQSHGRAQFI
jgi:hypothetical protein